MCDEGGICLGFGIHFTIPEELFYYGISNSKIDFLEVPLNDKFFTNQIRRKFPI